MRKTELKSPHQDATKFRLHRHRDGVCLDGTYIPDTIYMHPLTALKLARMLKTFAMDILQKDFVDSELKETLI